MADLRAVAQQALEALESVLCDPEGKCCIDGSDADRAVVDKELAALRAALAQAEPVQAVATFDEVWAAIDWDKWRLQPIRELVRMIQSKTSPAAPVQQAEPVQEPVAWMRPDNRVAEESYSRTQFSRGRDKPPIGTWTPLYTAPQQAEPVQRKPEKGNKS